MDDLNKQLGRTAPQPEEKKKKGCFFFGCLTLIVLLVLTVVALFYGVNYGLKQVVTSYGSSQPVELPTFAATPEESSKVVARVEQFIAAPVEGSAAAPLVLTAKDLNLLLLADPELGKLIDYLRFDIQNELVIATGTFNLESFGFGGQFVNLKLVYDLL